MTETRYLTSVMGVGILDLQAKHKECSMTYKVEFNDDLMRWADYAAVMDYETYCLPWSFIEELMDYLQGLGYEWNEIAYVRGQWAA